MAQQRESLVEVEEVQVEMPLQPATLELLLQPTV
jgi:hypothetical protein